MSPNKYLLVHSDEIFERGGAGDSQLPSPPTSANSGNLLSLALYPVRSKPNLISLQSSKGAGRLWSPQGLATSFPDPAAVFYPVVDSTILTSAPFTIQGRYLPSLLRLYYASQFRLLPSIQKHQVPIGEESPINLNSLPYHISIA